MAKKPWLPIALAGAGLFGLLSSWACFPPLMVAGGPPGTLSEPAPASPDAGSPSPSFVPIPSPPASAVPSASASFPPLAPAVGRVYVYRTGTSGGRLQVTVTALANAVATYASQTIPESGSPAPATTGEARLTNGVYWVFPDRPSPVTAAIDTYPAETVAVPAGTGTAAKVAAGAETYWFVEGVIVKAVTAAGTTELQEIK